MATKADSLPSIAELQAALDDCPFHRNFDYRIESANAEHGRLVLRQHYTDSVERLAGTRQYHGGAIASLIDIAGDFALYAALGKGVPTINIRVDFLRPAIDTDLVATATVRRSGRTVGVIDIEVIDDAGRIVALGRGCYGTS